MTCPGTWYQDWASGIFLVNHVSDSDIVELLKPPRRGRGRGFG